MMASTRSLPRPLEVSATMLTIMLKDSIVEVNQGIESLSSFFFSFFSHFPTSGADAPRGFVLDDEYTCSIISLGAGLRDEWQDIINSGLRYCSCGFFKVMILLICTTMYYVVHLPGTAQLEYSINIDQTEQLDELD